MDWSKLDARLAGALDEDDGRGRFEVFVHLAPDADPDDPLLSPLASGTQGAVRTAALSSEEVGRLSDRTDVHHIRLSATVRPVENG